jgi:hypothetical protein
MAKSTSPSIHETAFHCPHCGALTTQYWYSLVAMPRPSTFLTPFIHTQKNKDELLSSSEIPEDIRQHFLASVEEDLTGLVNIRDGEVKNSNAGVNNLHLNKCFNCKQIGVWVYDRLIFPPHKTGVQPNADMPADVKKDFEEARGIVDQSPRGAAALLRLCVQKLCHHLGEKGKNIDDDIASLVAKGLNPLIQQSLDIVRVVGNEAVHPGTLDLKDDRETAVRLFDILNVICDQMISHPKTVRSIYAKLPTNKLAGISKRDGAMPPKP